MIEVVIALCYALGAWFYSILRYYDLWKRGKVPVVFFAFLHVFSLIVVFLFETGISAMISDVVSAETTSEIIADIPVSKRNTTIKEKTCKNAKKTTGTFPRFHKS